MISKIKLDDVDRKKFIELYRRAQVAPVIITDFESKDQSSVAWDSVCKFIDKLGEKYNFIPSSISSIHSKMGIVKYRKRRKCLKKR